MLESFAERGGKNVLKNSLFEMPSGFFPEDLGKINDEHGKRFHQKIQTIEKRYQGRADKRLMADFLWLLPKLRFLFEKHIIRLVLSELNSFF